MRFVAVEDVDVSKAQLWVGQYGTWILAGVAALFVMGVVRRLFRAGRRTVGWWILASTSTTGVPGWVWLRTWLRSKGWLG